MKIALDYDGTFTADPELWSRFVYDAQALGHTVTIVTGRNEQREKITGPIPPVPVVYCSRTAKRKHFQADVYIDDNPRWVDTDERPNG